MRRPKTRPPRVRLKRPKSIKLPDELWFRVRTRFQAAGYWLREKALIVGGMLAGAGAWLAEGWRALSPAARRWSTGLAALVALVAIVRFVSVPGVPCQVSAAKECAPSDRSVALVPADALLYSHLTLDRGSHQYELAGALAARLPALRALFDQITASLPTPSGAGIDLGRDVLRWADHDLAVSLLPGPGRGALPLIVVGVADRAGAEAFLKRIAAPGAPRAEDERGTRLSVYPGGLAAAYVDGQLVFGSESAVRASLETAAGRTESLSSNPGPRAELPELRFADVYLSRAGVKRLLGGAGTGASQLDTFVDFGATAGMAASATARDGGVELNLISDLDPKLLRASPTVFSELPAFHPDLGSEAGSRALAYVGVGELGPTLAGLIGRAAGGGLAGSLRDLSKRLRSEAGVDPLKDLLPALSGQAALVAEPTGGAPFASLIVDGVDEERASKALSRLEEPLLRSLSGGGGQLPRFEQRQVDGVTVRSVRVSATVDLSYAVFDGKLVVSTDPAGIARVRAGGDGLAGTAAFQRVTGKLPAEASAVVFLNLDELLGLARQAGLAEDPLYASVSDDISTIEALGLAVTGTEDELRTELFLATG